MSLPKQSIHFIEKMIVAEYHTLSLQLERMQRLGLTGSEGDNHGR